MFYVWFGLKLKNRRKSQTDFASTGVRPRIGSESKRLLAPNAPKVCGARVVHDFVQLLLGGGVSACRTALLHWVLFNKYRFQISDFES